MKKSRIIIGFFSVLMCLSVLAKSTKATTIEDVIYGETYDAVNQCIEQYSQTSINQARVKILNMNKYHDLKFAVGEFSKLVDNVQQGLFQEFYSYLYDENHKEKSFISQDDINMARNYIVDFATYQGNEKYITSWSSKLDEYQGKIILKANNAVEQCKLNGSNENIAEAEKWIEELSSSNNQDCINEATRLESILNSIKPVGPDTPSQSVQGNSIIKKEIKEEKSVLGKKIYDANEYKLAIRGALRNFDKTLKVNLKNNGQADVESILKEAISGSQEIIYGYNGANWSIKDNGNGINEITMNFEYLYDKVKLMSERDAVNAKVNDIISKNITADMSKFEIELFFHDYLVENAFYDEAYIQKGGYRAEEHSAYGILVEGNGVCEGYAKAMSLLCKSVGIECNVITGYANEAHAWNIVKLDDNKWYNVDVTWDDPIYANGHSGLIKVTHKYFNIPNGEFIQTHNADVNMPVAYGTKYLRDNVNIAEYDMQGDEVKVINSQAQLKDMIKESILNDKPYMAARFSNVTLTSYEIGKIILEVCKENGFYLKYSVLYDGNPIKYFSITFKE